MTSINPTVSILSMLEPVAPKPCLAISGKQPPWFHSWVVSQPGGSPGNPAKLLEKDWRETTGNSSGNWRGPWFCNTHTIAADALLFGHSLGPSWVSTARSTFIRGWAGVLRASVELCCDPAMTRALHMAYRMTYLFLKLECLFDDVSWRFPFLFTERKHART